MRITAGEARTDIMKWQGRKAILVDKFTGQNVSGVLAIEDGNLILRTDQYIIRLFKSDVLDIVDDDSKVSIVVVSPIGMPKYKAYKFRDGPEYSFVHDALENYKVTSANTSLSAIQVANYISMLLYEGEVIVQKDYLRYVAVPGYVSLTKMMYTGSKVYIYYKSAKKKEVIGVSSQPPTEEFPHADEAQFFTSISDSKKSKNGPIRRLVIE